METGVKYYYLRRGVPFRPSGKESKTAAPSATGAKAQQVLERKAVAIKSIDDAAFGDMPLVQSQLKSGRQWTELSEMNDSLVGHEVWVRARIHRATRAGGKLCFIMLRRGFFTLQAIVDASASEQMKEMVAFAAKIPSESVVDVFGKLVKSKDPVQSAYFKNMELSVSRVYVVNATTIVLPFQLEDAARHIPKEEEEVAESTDSKLIRVNQKTRLDNRVLDLRTPANHAIYILQSAVATYFRAYFLSKQFVEIHSPKITPGVSEGGSAVFRLKYFGNNACLAQSPQLFKQMAVLSDLFRVFEIGPVFRAEPHDTYRHLCEFTGLDFEMEIKEHYHEVLQVLGELFVHIFDRITANHKSELSAIAQQYPFEPLRYPRETRIIAFPVAISMLRQSGVKIDDMEDFSTDQEKLLGKIIREKYDTDFYIVDQYPITARPFYTMPSALDPRYTNSYDVFVRGEEITSGAQRVHDVELLRKRAADCNIPESNIASYVDAFKCGAYPHGGAGIGLERLLMLYLGLNNIRKSSMFPRDPNRLNP